ncbi:MAG: hypothetical protein GC154_08585, partial [bacterium]|nr:hypothetical protein [bacterium]
MSWFRMTSPMLVVSIWLVSVSPYGMASIVDEADVSFYVHAYLYSYYSSVVSCDFTGDGIDDWIVKIDRFDADHGLDERLSTVLGNPSHSHGYSSRSSVFPKHQLLEGDFVYHAFPRFDAAGSLILCASQSELISIRYDETADSKIPYQYHIDEHSIALGDYTTLLGMTGGWFIGEAESNDLLIAASNGSETRLF